MLSGNTNTEICIWTAGKKYSVFGGIYCPYKRTSMLSYAVFDRSQ